MTSIIMITNRTIKVEVNDIVDRHLISKMRDAISSLKGIGVEWMSTGSLPEIDWSRMRAMEFQELLRSRDTTSKKLGNRCLSCPHFNEHVRHFLLFAAMTTYMVLD